MLLRDDSDGKVFHLLRYAANVGIFKPFGIIFR